MSLYMLDTDTCSYIMKRSNDAVLKRLQKLPVSDACSSVITKLELLFGVEISPRRQQDEVALNAFLRYVEVLDFHDAASVHYAKIRADLKKLGMMIGANGSVHCCSRAQPRLDAGHKQYARVRAGLRLSHRKLDARSLGEKDGRMIEANRLI
jgi:tRNA(fMet)-specific endonuclease VapC